MNILRRRWLMKKHLGKSSMRGISGSFPSSMSGNNQSRLLKYYCMGCRKEHREIACPNCGSKMKSVG
ncbi:MAG TPA: hypothetical protein VE573_02205 [Nitrososphaeraceae archaeon]|nr:hypothetical protein [Nitrososphaeraceae archaeon]